MLGAAARVVVRRTAGVPSTSASSASVATAATAAMPSSRAHLRIVSINDVYELRMLPRLRSLVDAHRAQHGGALITTLCGDFVSPSTLSSMDQGASMVSVLNRIPITHACFGNHEADLQLDELARRTEEFGGKWLNANVIGFKPELPTDDLLEVATKYGKVRVGLLGLLLSEKGVFRKDQFRGLNIEDSLTAAQRVAASLRQRGADIIIALTHQSLAADAQLSTSGCVDLILGGHEHEVIHHVPEGGVPIVKSGSDAHQAAVVDVSLCEQGVEISVAFEDTMSYAPHAEVDEEVGSHLAVLQALEREVVCEVPLGGALLSSKGVRRQQTTIGTLLTSTVRDCLQADVAIINGGTIKGNRDYPEGQLNYLDLQQELPFPTKMVVVRMPATVLQDAVSDSRACAASEEKRGFLQVDSGVKVVEAEAHRIVSIGNEPFDPAREYNVALPRNLLKGIFNIQPLVDFAQAHPEAMANEDAYLPALNLILMQQAKEIWRRLGDFDELDRDGNQQLDREEITLALEERLGTKPSSILLDNVIRSVDVDNSGTIDRTEYEGLSRAPLSAPPS